jgi:exonuclease III
MKPSAFLLTLFCFLSVAPAFSQSGRSPGKETPAIFYESFDGKSADFKKAASDLITQRRFQAIYQPVYSAGISGKALDLSGDVPMRTPMVLNDEQRVRYTKDQSFSIVAWVKTKKGARQGTPIWTNKRLNARDAVGWCLGTQDNGAWYWNMSDGKVAYNYDPTPQRQAINDGNWHQLAISVDRSRQEVWMYMDGRNVAIYRLEQYGLESMESSQRTIVGGSDDYYDFGSNGEWTAFNGLIDEVAMYDRPLKASEVKAAYERLTGQKDEPLLRPDRLKVQAWNIWHGGRRFGLHVGVERTVEMIREQNADIVGLVETYGSGAIIADALGYHFYLISSNLSIMSRYPIEETIAVFKPFHSGGALIHLGNNQRLAVFDIWLYYKGEERRAGEIQQILKEIDGYVRNADDVPVIMVGDFNTSSHLDPTEETAAPDGDAGLDRPVSRLMEQAGFVDSYRAVHPNAVMSPGFTWSPLRNEIHMRENGLRSKRIDFIYYKSKKLLPYHSLVLDSHPVFFPSDHASVVTLFYLDH